MFGNKLDKTEQKVRRILEMAKTKLPRLQRRVTSLAGPVKAYSPRGMDYRPRSAPLDNPPCAGVYIDRNGVVWVAVAAGP